MRFGGIDRGNAEGVDLARTRLEQLVASGLPPDVATQVAVCELSLTGAAAADAVDHLMSAQVAAALTDTAIYDAVRRHCVAPEWASVWDRFARWSVDPVRARCLEMAQLCRRRRLRVVS